MRTFSFIFIGGFFGSVFRYLISGTTKEMISGGIPLHTLLVNVSGCFLLALIYGLVATVLTIDEDLTLGMATGFLGAYTTFSAISGESVQMILKNDYTNMFIYLGSTVFFGAVATYCGYLLAKKIADKASNEVTGE